MTRAPAASASAVRDSSDERQTWDRAALAGHAGLLAHPAYARLVTETAAWEKRRNAERARIKWIFTTEKARAKMGRAYPKPECASG